MVGIVTGGGRKEQEVLSINHVIPGSVDGVAVEVRGMTDGFSLRKLPGQAGQEDTYFAPGEKLFLDDGTRIESALPENHPPVPYDQFK